MSALPIATRWRSPPDRFCGARSSSLDRPSSSTVSSNPIDADAPGLRPRVA